MVCSLQGPPIPVYLDCVISTRSKHLRARPTPSIFSNTEQNEEASSSSPLPSCFPVPTPNTSKCKLPQSVIGQQPMKRHNKLPNGSAKPKHLDVRVLGSVSPLQMSPAISRAEARKVEAERYDSDEELGRISSSYDNGGGVLSSSWNGTRQCPPRPPPVERVNNDDERIAFETPPTPNFNAEEVQPLCRADSETARYDSVLKMTQIDEKAQLIPPTSTTSHHISSEDDDEEQQSGAGRLFGTVPEIVLTEVAAYEDRTHYDWTDFYKSKEGANFLSRTIRFLRWIVTGLSRDMKQSDDEIQENLNSLARLLSMLREYHDRFGMPTKGGPKDQEYILREVTKDLYWGGVPIWALEPVMKRVAEGLTGRTGIEFFMLPRRTFIFDPNGGGTRLVRTVRGYDMQRLDAMESVAVRLASFASNTSSTSSVPSRFPHPSELKEAYRSDSVADFMYTKEEMSEEILTLASEAEGLFFYINSHHESACTRGNFTKRSEIELGEFWTIEDNIKELFSRLAAIEAVTSIDKIDVERKTLYSATTFSSFRFLASASACAFWFGGSWVDIIISGILAVVVALIGSSPLLSVHERIVFEAVAGFLIGLLSGLISITFPNQVCFGALAISGVLDLLQGFRVVYAIIEVMSRHTVTGGADFLEGILFTALIAYFLKFGELAAIEILGEQEDSTYLECKKGVSHWWYFLFVPLACVSWSGLFNPHYIDLPLMAGHGILGYILSQQFVTSSTTSNASIFVASTIVTFSSGLISRFTGRQALGNTVAGIYVLLPGAYMVSEVYGSSIENFISTVILRSVIIGIGAWTGTILCSPTLLGTNRGFVQPQPGAGQGSAMLTSSSSASSIKSTSTGGSNLRWRRREKTVRKQGGALLFF